MGFAHPLRGLDNKPVSEQKLAMRAGNGIGCVGRETSESAGNDRVSSGIPETHSQPLERVCERKLSLDRGGCRDDLGSRNRFYQGEIQNIARFETGQQPDLT